jgi:hypothetical protein
MDSTVVVMLEAEVLRGFEERRNSIVGNSSRWALVEVIVGTLRVYSNDFRERMRKKV